MKQINFKKLTIKNFMSVGSEPVVIEFKEGMNVITGVNRDEEGIKNGVGKSVVIDAFYWAIFGDSLRELPKQFIANRKNPKGCVVTLEFEDVSTRHGEEYFVIERSLGPSRLRVFKNDIDKTKSTIPETNKYIREVLSANEEIFQDCIIMRANSTVPFMSKKKTDKKNFIESIFNLSIFSDMLKLLKEDVREMRRQYDIESKALSIYEENIANYERQIASLREEERTRQARYEQARAERLSQIDKEERSLVTYRAAADKLATSQQETDTSALSAKENSLVTCSNQLITKRAELDAERRASAREYKRVDAIGDKCPTCNRPYEEEMVNNNKTILSELKEKIATYEGVIEKVDAKKTEVDTALAEVRRSIRELENAREQERKKLEAVRTLITKTEGNVTMYRRLLAELDKNNAVATNPAKPFEEMLAGARRDEEEKKQVVDACERRLGTYNICSFALGEEGIRSYVVNKLLELLNGRIHYYLRAFKSTFTFTFDKMFNETIKDNNGIACLYANCSGAEQKKVDLAVSFAFLDVLKYHSQVVYNVNFYDEILDSSLDNKSLENLINFIDSQTTEQQKCTYIITHKADINLPNLTEVVMLEKRNGFTSRNYDTN